METTHEDEGSTWMKIWQICYWRLGYDNDNFTFFFWTEEIYMVIL